MHVYFVDILRKIVTTIRRCIVVQDMTNSASTKDTNNLTNRFGHLASDTAESGDEEEKEGEHGEDYTEPITSAPDIPARFGPKIDREEEDKLLYSCFLDDIADIRAYIDDLWRRYLDEEDHLLSLHSATLLTEMALEHVTALEDAIKDKVGHDTDLFHILVTSLTVPYDWSIRAKAIWDITQASAASCSRGRWPCVSTRSQEGRGNTMPSADSCRQVYVPRSVPHESRSRMGRSTSRYHRLGRIIMPVVKFPRKCRADW